MLSPRPISVLFKLFAATLVVLAVALVGCSGDDASPSSAIDTDAGPYGDGGSGLCPGATLCGNTCVDTRLDPNHCGACGHACGAGQLCIEGACQSNDATLASLTFSSGTLSPAFSPATTVYVLEASSLLDLRVTATPTAPNATLTLNGAPLAAGVPSERIVRKGVIPTVSLHVATPGGATTNYTIVLLGTAEVYAKASNPGVDDGFGTSVAIDGDTLAVGAPYEDSNATGVNQDQTNNSAANSGAVYVFTRSGGTWSQQAYIKASNTGGGDTFGSSVALSGDTLVVGAPGESSNATGVNGDQTNNSATAAGAVYLFTRSGTTWSQQAYIKASNTGAGDYFGLSVALSGDTLAVGAPEESSNAKGVNGDQTNNSASGAGAVYVFTRSGTTWSQQAYIKASNTGAGHHFGQTVALFGDTLAVGAPYESSNAKGVNGDQTNTSASMAGAVYVFTRSGTTWSQQAYIKASNTDENDNFGRSVALSGDTLAVGAPHESSNASGINGSQTDNSVSRSGAVYVFTRSGTTWSQQAYIKASNTGGSDNFGHSLALSGDILAVGAVFEDSNATGIGGDQTNNSALDSGAVYVFTRSGGTWSQFAYVKASNADPDDYFGLSLALSGESLAVGAGWERSKATGIGGDRADDSMPGAGAVYLF